MSYSEINKNTALILLKNFIFPLKNLLSESDTDTICDFMVSIHETNGFQQNGFLVNESIFEVQNIREEYCNDTVKLINRYLCNIEFIRLSVEMRLRDIHKAYTVVVKFSTNEYTISKLSKTFKHEELPSTDDIDYLVSDFKREYASFSHK